MELGGDLNFNCDLKSTANSECDRTLHPQLLRNPNSVPLLHDG